MRNAGLPAFILLLAFPFPASAASADPSLLPEFDRKAAPRTSAPVRRPTPPPPEETAPPAEESRYGKGDRELEEIARKAARRSEAEPRPWVRVRERTWLMRGYNETRTSGPAAPGQFAPSDVTIGDTSITRMDGSIALVEAEFTALSWLSVLGEFGTTRNSGGSMTIDSWVHAPDASTLTELNTGATWNKPDHAAYSRYVGSNGGDKTTWAAASVALRIAESHASVLDVEKIAHSLDFLIGAHVLREHSNMTDLVLQMNDGKVAGGFPQGTRFPGQMLDSNWTWQGPHIGLRDEVRLPADFGVNGTVLWSPFMEYRGDAFDAFAANAGDARVQAPNVIDRAHGTAIHFRLGADWRWRFLAFEAGYQRLYFYSRSGVHRTFAPDGSSSDLTLDHAVTERGGFYAGGSVRF